jgi:hypothetical protein
MMATMKTGLFQKGGLAVGTKKILTMNRAGHKEEPAYGGGGVMGFPGG